MPYAASTADVIVVVYGPTDGGVSKQKNALQFLINEIKANNEIKLYYDGNFVRDYMHVDDVCKAIYTVLNRADYNQIINIGSGISQNFREIIDFVIKETKSTSKKKKNLPSIQESDSSVDPNFLFGKWKNLDINAKTLRRESWKRA